MSWVFNVIKTRDLYMHEMAKDPNWSCRKHAFKYGKSHNTIAVDIKLAEILDVVGKDALPKDKTEAVRFVKMLTYTACGDYTSITKLDHMYNGKLVDLNRVEGVYHLFNNDILVYIGSAMIINYRVNVHKSEGLIPFNICKALYMPLDDARIVEKCLISILKPPYNKSAFYYKPTDADMRVVKNYVTA